MMLCTTNKNTSKSRNNNILKNIIRDIKSEATEWNFIVDEEIQFNKEESMRFIMVEEIVFKIQQMVRSLKIVDGKGSNNDNNNDNDNNNNNNEILYNVEVNFNVLTKHLTSLQYLRKRRELFFDKSSNFMDGVLKFYENIELSYSNDNNNNNNNTNENNVNDIIHNNKYPGQSPTTTTPTIPTNHTNHNYSPNHH
eukprot:Pgem_evm1s722